MSEKLDEMLMMVNKLDSIEITLNNLCSKMAIVEDDDIEVESRRTWHGY